MATDASGIIAECLPLAASHNWPEVVQELLRIGVPVDSIHERGRTALIYRAMSGDTDDIRYLIQHGASPYIEDELRQDVLWYACEKGYLDVVQLLLQTRTVTVNGNMRAHFTPLSIAAYNGHVDVVSVLLNDGRIDSTAATQEGMTPVAAAALGNRSECCSLLLDHIIHNGEDISLGTSTPHGHVLPLVAAPGFAEQILLLLDKSKMDPNAIHHLDEYGIVGEEPGFRMFGSDCLIRFYGSKSAGIAARQRKGWAILHYASELGHVSLTEMLLARDDVNPNSSDERNRSPLWIACALGQVDVAEVLLRKSAATLNVADDAGFTPLLAAARGKRISLETAGDLPTAFRSNHLAVIELLLHQPDIELHQAYPNRKGFHSSGAYDIEESDFHISHSYKCGTERFKSTILTVAAGHGCKEITEYLVNAAYPGKQMVVDGANAALFAAVSNASDPTVNRGYLFHYDPVIQILLGSDYCTEVAKNEVRRETIHGRKLYRLPQPHRFYC